MRQRESKKERKEWKRERRKSIFGSFLQKNITMCSIVGVKLMIFGKIKINATNIS